MLLEYWLLALRSKVGIAIPTNNRAMLRQQLYKARYEAKDPRLDDIVMIIPENETEIWLVHKNADEANIRSTRTDMVNTRVSSLIDSNGND